MPDDRLPEGWNAHDVFNRWWEREGVSLDPDTQDVPWFDKRRALAEMAFRAALHASRNYIADTETEPQEITFLNGRRVRLVTNGDDEYLAVGQLELEP